VLNATFINNFVILCRLVLLVGKETGENCRSAESNLQTLKTCCSILVIWGNPISHN